MRFQLHVDFVNLDHGILILSLAGSAPGQSQKVWRYLPRKLLERFQDVEFVEAAVILPAILPADEAVQSPEKRDAAKMHAEQLRHLALSLCGGASASASEIATLTRIADQI